MFDHVTDESFTPEELFEAKEHAIERLRLWRRRWIFSAIALFLSCACVTPFLYGHSLHKYWEVFGKYLVLISMGLLLPFVYCAGLFWGAWVAVRDIEKGNL